MHHFKSRFKRSRTPTPEARTPTPEAATHAKPQCTTDGKTSKDLRPDVTAVSKTLPAIDSEPFDLWDQAYTCLREDAGSRKHLEAYEKILLSELSGEDSSDYIPKQGFAREKQMAALVDKKLDIVEKARWRFQLGQTTVEVKAQVDRIAKAVLFAKDFVTSAASTDPHAALAWAGVSVLLPVSSYGTYYI